MKPIQLLLIILTMICLEATAQEYHILTSVESIIPAGLGRSRLISAEEMINTDEITTARDDGQKSEMNKVKRKDIKIDKFEETKLLNFYSATGINFQNVASNDSVIASKLTEMTKAGWTLKFVTSGVESDSGGTDGYGIFVTRYIFYRE